MAEQERVLGPGAKGDPENPAERITPEDLEGATVAEVRTALESEQVTPEQVAAAEAEREGDPRTGVERLVDQFSEGAGTTDPAGDGNDNQGADS